MKVGMALATGAAFATGAVAQVRKQPGVSITPIKLSMSNAFLIKGPKPILVDTGTSADLKALTQALAKENVKLTDISLIVLTHGHSDHAGCAAEIRRQSGAKIALGFGDEAMAKEGHNDELKPTGILAIILKNFAIGPEFPNFVPDILVRAPLDLAPWGLAGKLTLTPGHTPGSMAVVLNDGRAVLGDILMGGYFGGAILPARPGVHYFYENAEKNRESLKWLLQQNISTLYLGHGGPVIRGAVMEAFGLH